MRKYRDLSSLSYSIRFRIDGMGTSNFTMALITNEPSKVCIMIRNVTRFYHAARNLLHLGEALSFCFLRLFTKPVRISHNEIVFYKIELSGADSKKHSKGECKMNMPSSLAGWCTILFFLLFGLSLLGLAIPSVIIGILALGVAVFTLIGR